MENKMVSRYDAYRRRGLSLATHVAMMISVNGADQATLLVSFSIYLFPLSLLTTT